MKRKSKRIRPRHPKLGAAGFRLALPLLERFYASRNIYRSTSAFAVKCLSEARSKLDRGDTIYVAGLGAAGTHNSGVALVAISRETGPRVICNNEEERFSGKKHSTAYPRLAIDALDSVLRRTGIDSKDIAAWIGTFDYAAFGATMLRTALEEPPVLRDLLRAGANPGIDLRSFFAATDTPRILSQQLGRDEPVPIISMPHHDNHAWFSYAVSPFAGSDEPVMISVVDGTGDLGAISLYLAQGNRMRQLSCNQSVFDSLGLFYGVVSSTQGGWTYLSSEGRYMGAAAYGNLDRNTNPFYSALKGIFSLEPEGQVRLNRSLANWQRSMLHTPYTPELIRLIGAPVAPKDMWNPDAVLRVEESERSKTTQERLDKAAATQLVFEDALVHIVDHLIRSTGSTRLVLTGGTALNAVANMRLLEHFDEAFYERVLGRRARLHLWVPPTPADSGATMGAAYMFAHMTGAEIGAPLDHAFYCGLPPGNAEIRTALDAASDISWMCIGDVRQQRDAITDLMAFITANDGVLAIVQGSAETGPRALGHRSILANPCNPDTRAVLNARVKYREAIRPLAPMATLAAAWLWFDLAEGAADNDYNAYNYMVLTARAKPEARARIPAVIHVDGTARVQIVRAHTDPVTYSYLQALGRRIGVEVAVNTSFNVAGPIAQTAVQAIATLRRSKGMDAVLMFSEEGPVYAAWHGGGAEAEKGGGRFRHWLREWQAETGGLADA